MAKRNESRSAASGSGSAGITRADFLKRGAAGVGVLSVPGLIAACGGSSTGSSSASTPAGGKPARGGNLKVGLAGGGGADTLDAHLVRSTADNMRHNALYDQLTQVNNESKLVNMLAEEVSSNKRADEWTIRLRAGVEFHNGKTVDADDVIFSIRRILNPKSLKTGAGQLWGIDYNGMKKLDARTVQIKCVQPFSVLDNSLGDGATNFIVPVGYNPAKPIGTGPYMYESFTPGQQSVFKRNPNYWNGPAMLDTLTMIDMTDDSARVNALMTGQVQAIDSVPTNQVAAMKGNSQVRLLISPTGGFSPIYMRCDKPPFSDNRVRQAMRLVMNRPQAVQQALGGYGRVASDNMSPYDPAYDASLVRHQDIAQAKSLLKSAGQQNLNVQLVTSPVEASTIPGTQVLAQNAKQAGINIQLNQVDPGTLYGTNFLSWDFAVDWYPALSYIDEASLLTAGKHASTNLSHFDDPQYNKLYAQALAAVDESQRNQILREMQKIDFERGGMIIYAYPDTVDAYSSKVGGFPAVDKPGMGLGGGTFHTVHFLA